MTKKIDDKEINDKEGTLIPEFVHTHKPHPIVINLSVQVGLAIKNVKLIPCMDCKLVYFEELPDTYTMTQAAQVQNLRLVK